MEILNNEEKKQNLENELWKNWEEKRKRGRIVGGFIFLLAGALFLLREVGFAIPHLILSWQMLFITIGIYTGIKNKFRNFSWIFFLAVGSLFMLQSIYPSFAIAKYFWPSLIMIIGLRMIFKPHHKFNNKFKHQWHRSKHWQTSGEQYNKKKNSDEYLEVNAVLGSVKKNIISKNFSGGEINCVMAGCEVNLTNADFIDSTELEVNIVMGGTRLIIPSHWIVKSELTAVMGGVDDKRNIIADADNKVLIIKGAVVMGGIEINSF
jgi:predicted membrane protein